MTFEEKVLQLIEKMNSEEKEELIIFLASYWYWITRILFGFFHLYNDFTSVLEKSEKSPGYEISDNFVKELGKFMNDTNEGKDAKI
jgi:hypothetical protein